MTIAIIIATLIALKIPRVTKVIIGGMIKSITTRSLANLVTILPIGLASKN